MFTVLHPAIVGAPEFATREAADAVAALAPGALVVEIVAVTVVEIDD